MSRTRWIPALAALLACLVSSPSAAEQRERINGIGMIDYAARPTFRVGTWSKYRVTAKSELGVTDDYTVTVLIAGEEEFWGQPGFWVETWTDVPGEPQQTTATLMSYAIFADSLALPRVQTYQLKTIAGLRPDGTPDEQIVKRPASTLKSREPLGGHVNWDVDTLGTETVTTPKGPLTCRKVKIDQGVGVTAQAGDSTFYTEVRETRHSFVSPVVPITHIAREEIDYGFTRRAWLIGRSQDSGPTRTMDRSKGAAELVDFGDGLPPRLVPESYRKPLAQPRAATPASRATATTTKKRRS